MTAGGGMAPLMAWLRPIIILLVVVGLVEMMVPHGALRRYVDVFLGVLLLGALLQPMVSLLGGPMVWDPGGLVDEAWQEEGGPPPPRLGAAAAPELAREVFARRLEREVVRLARTVDGVVAAAAQITLAPAPPGQVPAVAAVHLGLVLGDTPDPEPPEPAAPPLLPGDAGATGGYAMVPVEPIRPVVPVAPTGPAGPAGSSAAGGAGEAGAPGPPPGQGDAGPWWPGAPQPVATAVLTLLQHHFDFPPEVVTLYWRPAAGEGRESLDGYAPGTAAPE